jgi:DNA-binding response OmpR family regulator
MKNHSAVLLYGHDELLLWTRRLVLEWAGYEVSVAQELRQASQLLDQEDVGLIVLCYSLSRAECAELIATSPSEVPTLLITECGEMGNRDCDMREVADTCFDSILGPEALVRKVDAILHIKRPHTFPIQMDRRYASQGVA